MALLAAVDPSPWTFHAHPDVWAVVLTLAGAYYLAVTRFAGASDVTTAKQKASFATGVVLLWAFADWPMHDLSERFLFSAHMVQHLVFSLIVAPLLVMGTPPWLLRRIARPAAIGNTLRVIAKPIPATLLFNAIVVITHLPPYVDLSVRNEMVHLFAHFVLVVVSLVMWLPVINRLPELPSLSVPGSMLYLFVQSIVPTVPASFMAFATRPLYRAYIDAPHPWIGAVEDQQLAGAIMKVGGGALLWGSIIYLFFRWYSRGAEGGDVLTWAEVEAELAKAELGKAEFAANGRAEVTPSGS
ncbi:MAG: cytochrome c oxidase assembly protein [Acidimicrobiales bacterium]